MCLLFIILFELYAGYILSGDPPFSIITHLKDVLTEGKKGVLCIVFVLRYWSNEGHKTPLIEGHPPRAIF